MDFDCPHLPLSPHWVDEDERKYIVLVCKVDAIRLSEHGEFKTVQTWEAIRELRRRSRSFDRELGDFLSRTSLDPPSGRRLRPHELIAQAVDYLRLGVYAGVRRVRAARWGDDDPSSAQVRLVLDIERGTAGRLWADGRKYKLVAGADVDGLPERSSYEVVGHDEAVRVLDKVGLQYAARPRMPALFTEARAKLSADWRPPLPPKGLVLLRKIMAVRSASTEPGPAITPSQMHEMMKPAQSYQFVWDQPFSQRQWVNLPSSWGVVAFGQVATLTGHVEPREAGQVVSFTLLPDPGNPREATAMLESAAATSGEDGKVQIEMAFPIHPGAKFKVSGKTSTMSAGVESEPITVWRRVYYQITVMDPAPDKREFKPPADLIAALAPAFDPVWIDFAPGTKASATTPYKAHLTNDERWALENSLKPSSRDDRSPFKMNIVLIDTADIVAEYNWSGESVGPQVETDPFTLWPYDPTVIWTGYEQSPGLWAPLADIQVVDLLNGKHKVKATIPGQHPSPVNYRLYVRCQRGFGGGWGGTTGTIFLCMGRMRQAKTSLTGASLQPTLTHEIGHALGLVSSSSPWHDPDPRDNRYSLRHCGRQSAEKKPLCVMWWTSAGRYSKQFCSGNAPNDCTHYLLNADLSTIRWI